MIRHHLRQVAHYNLPCCLVVPRSKAPKIVLDGLRKCCGTSEAGINLCYRFWSFIDRYHREKAANNPPMIQGRQEASVCRWRNPVWSGCAGGDVHRGQCGRVMWRRSKTRSSGIARPEHRCQPRRLPTILLAQSGNHVEKLRNHKAPPGRLGAGELLLKSNSTEVPTT
jgi:hypothetical protein